MQHCSGGRQSYGFICGGSGVQRRHSTKQLHTDLDITAHAFCLSFRWEVLLEVFIVAIPVGLGASCLCRVCTVAHCYNQMTKERGLTESRVPATYLPLS